MHMRLTRTHGKIKEAIQSREQAIKRYDKGLQNGKLSKEQHKALVFEARTTIKALEWVIKERETCL
jgi:hypothetical protein